MDEQIANFIAITSATPQIAQRYLTQSNGNVQEAIDTFLAVSEGDPQQEVDAEPAQQGGHTLGGSGGGQLPEGWGKTSAGGTGSRVGRVGQWGSSSGSGSSTPRTGGGGGPRIATFGSLAARSAGPANSGDGDDESDKEGEDWYAGGERSGLNVQNPDAPGRNEPGIVSDILKKARQAGPPPTREEPSSRTAPSWGSGNTLGSDTAQSVVVPDPNSAMADEDEDDDEDEDEVAVRHLTFWRNGFSLEDGPLREYDAPGSREILEAINNGSAPLSMLNIRPGQQVEVRVQRRVTEDWQPAPPKPRQAFDGVGNRLGAPVPAVVPSSSAMPGGFGSSTTPAAQPPALAEPTSTQFEVDPNLPTTSLQIRLGDGTRLPAKVNLTHTVGDVRRYIDGSRPGQRAYVLQMTFPNRDLTDETLTVDQAGLKNAVIVQRWV